MHGSVQWYLAGVIGLVVMGAVAMGGRAQTLDPRLAVSDQEEGIIRVMDTTDGSMIAEFPLPGPAGQLNTTESGRYAGVLIGDDIDQVHFLDSGVALIPHLDHAHAELEEPELLPFQLGGPESGAANRDRLVGGPRAQRQCR